MLRKRIFSLLLILGSLIAACGPQNVLDPQGDPLQSWIDAPLNGSTIPLTPYQIVFSGASLEGTVESFELWVNGLMESSIPAAYQSGQVSQYAYGQHTWTPPALGSYLIEVRAMSGGQSSAFAQANIMVGELSEGSEEQTVAPSEIVVIAVPIQNANCRLGASSTHFDIVDTLFAETEYIPNARGNDNQWVRLTGPVYGGNCWVFIDSLQIYLNDDLVNLADVPESILPFAAYPPTPTPTATSEAPTSTPTPTPVPTQTPIPPPA